MLVNKLQTYKGKKVLVTGHTGFKGAWLCLWLNQLGAKVSGYSLDPEGENALFSELHLAQSLEHDFRSDIRDKEVLNKAIDEVKPDFIFHLAAQALVRDSYEISAETFEVNTLGTAYLLEALKDYKHPCTVVCITTDKCYENKEWLHGYREEDPMGGADPYSASKGAAELVIASYRRSFFSDEKSLVKVASARAGNVIGGGDWAKDRIVPDCFRSINSKNAILVRNRHATRPWQHVLEPLGGYLILGASLSDKSADKQLSTGMNFGPLISGNKSVEELVKEILKHAEGSWEDQTDESAPHEASKLHLSVDKAYHLLGWLPVWDFQATIARTSSWYIKRNLGVSAQELCLQDIKQYENDLK